jgi:hypothetical protein
MSSLKCPQCGLTNFATAPACKRCKVPFYGDAAYAEAAYADVPEQTQPAAGFYEPQEQQYNPGSPQGVWRDGKLLVTIKDATLPNRCIKCNAPAMKLLKRQVEWYPRYVLLVFLLIRIVGIILYFCLRRRATIYIGLCEDHINKRRFGMLIGGSVMTAGFLLFFGQMSSDPNIGLIMLGLMMALVGICVMVSVYRTVSATKIEEPYVWVKGVNQDFLNDLPNA